MGQDYETYKAQLEAAGVARRNQAEIDAAWYQTMILDLAPVAALFESYSPPVRPLVPPPPSISEARASTKAAMKEEGAYRWWRSADRSQRDQRTTELLAEIEQRRTQMQAEIDAAFERFEQLEPATNLLVLQAAFADNAGTAAPLDLDGRDLLVLMSYPPPKVAIWPETTSQTAAGRQGVRKRKVAEINDAYRSQLMCHVLATAREALGVQRALESCRIVVVLEEEGLPLKDMKVLLDGTFSRSTLDALVEAPAEAWIPALHKAVDAWRRGASAEELGPLWNAQATQVRRVLPVLQEIERLFSSMVEMKVSEKGKVGHVGELGRRFGDELVDALAVDEGELALEDIPTLDAQGAPSVDFWLEVAELSASWRGGLG